MVKLFYLFCVPRPELVPLLELRPTLLFFLLNYYGLVLELTLPLEVVLRCPAFCTPC